MLLYAAIVEGLMPPAYRAQLAAQRRAQDERNLKEHLQPWSPKVKWPPRHLQDASRLKEKCPGIGRWWAWGGTEVP